MVEKFEWKRGREGEKERGRTGENNNGRVVEIRERR
jgi:hypothetical protein